MGQYIGLPHSSQTQRRPARTKRFKLLENLDSLCTESNFKGGIIWCYSEVTAVPREMLSKLGKSIQYQEGLPENFGNAQGEPSLIILDDLLNQVYSREVCDLFTKDSHHRNIAYYF